MGVAVGLVAVSVLVGVLVEAELQAQTRSSRAVNKKEARGGFSIILTSN
jgi:hypothetical protein